MPNSATLVQALGAAFCAILCATATPSACNLSNLSNPSNLSNFSVGGGCMRMAQHVAAWAKSGGWVNPYVTDGLVAMWDGEWNAGGGVHDPNATTWKDLVSSYDYTGTCGWSGDSIMFNGGQRMERQYSDLPVTSVEIVLACVEINSAGWIFSVGANNGVNSACYFFVQNGKFNCGDKRIENRNVSCSLESNARSSISVNFDSFTIHKNGIEQSKSGSVDYWGFHKCTIGANYYNGWRMPFKGEISSIRVYNRALTVAEIAANYAVDVERFNLT